MQLITIKNKDLYVINVPNDSYNHEFDYNCLVVTSASTGHKSRFKINNIEKYEIVGMFEPNIHGILPKHLIKNKCFKDTDKVVVIRLKQY